MNTLSQWIHQHNFLLLVCAIFLVSLVLLLWLKRWNKHTAIVWGISAVLAIALLFSLRTPNATVSQRLDKPVQLETTISIESTILDFETVDDIETYLANGDKPTLVEIYADLGIS